MLKVSLLPASYKQFLEGKKKKDFILKIALVVLLCMLIIYVGFAVKSFILQAQYKEISRANAQVQGEIAQYQKYKTAYDTYQADVDKLNSVLGRDPVALDFLITIKDNRPDYIKINKVSLYDWSNTAVCRIEGELPTAQDYIDAENQLEAYANSFLKAPYNCASVRIIGEGPMSGGSITGEQTYSFCIYVSLENSNIDVDASGGLITSETSTTATTVPPASTAASSEE